MAEYKCVLFMIRAIITVNLMMLTIINRPGVAGAVLQTSLSFIYSISGPFAPNL